MSQPVLVRVMTHVQFQNVLPLGCNLILCLICVLRKYSVGCDFGRNSWNKQYMTNILYLIFCDFFTQHCKVNLCCLCYCVSEYCICYI